MRAPTDSRSVPEPQRFATAVAGLAAGALVLAALAVPADAGKKKKKKAKKTDDIVDVSAVKAQFEVYTDGEGGYFVVAPGDTDMTFHGDGKTMYRQRSISSSRNGAAWSRRMWSPRVDHVADLSVDGGKGTMACGEESYDITQVTGAEATKIIDKAVFKKPLWTRQAHALSRDDRGVYYYVDRNLEEYGGKGYRLFAGQKGAMKELGLTNIVSDSEGEIFASKKGELRFVQEQTKAVWIKGDKRTELVAVPLDRNLAMIYGELGVYEGSLGTPCDEY